MQDFKIAILLFKYQIVFNENVYSGYSSNSLTSSEIYYPKITQNWELRDQENYSLLQS